MNSVYFKIDNELTMKIQKMKISSSKIPSVLRSKNVAKNNIFTKYKLLYSNNNDLFFYTSLPPFVHALYT